jgi:uncharacterized protein (DUF58 family)
MPVIAALAGRRFSPRRRFEGSFSGRHPSNRQGGAAEFADYREFTEGEDPRRLDWKVLARTGRAYIRLHHDETNLACMLVLDMSGSMSYAGLEKRWPAKLDYAKYLCTALSYLIGMQQDQAGLALVGTDLSDFLPPGGTTSHIDRLHQLIEAARPQPGSNLAGALQTLFQRLTRRAVYVVVSDFLVDELDSLYAALRMFRHRQSEVLLLHVIHPEEERLPTGRAFRLEGMERDGSVNASPVEIAESYERRFRDHVAAVREMGLAAGCEYRRVSLMTPYVDVLHGLMTDRSG